MTEISKAYEPQSVEDKWYQFWLDQKCFVADPARVSPKRPAYSIVIPPPNVTGVLTMGHVLNNTIQDILARKARMDGKEVLWLPGTDHAGIATQTVVERTLKKSGEIKHRDDLGREKFLERVWQWKEKHGGIIIQQLKKLGASCDWTRERFTMDPEYSKCVQKVFVELYKKGLIYRGKRMVNWCPVSLTALSDEEVVMKEQKGSLYYFKVEIAEQPGTFLTIATTRPETIPGDTAVAVNPKDPRYAKFIGKHVIRPLPAELPREQKLIPIIGDEHVDFEFGTGVLKVTPAHDKADFEIGQRHGLPQIDIMHPNGHMNELAGMDLDGLDRFKARKVATEKLAEIGALEKEEPYTNNVGFSERADVPIEPRLSEQWFLKYPGVEPSKACVAQDSYKAAVNVSERIAPVVSATGKEITGRSIHELRKAALVYARKHGTIGVPIKNEDSGIRIRVGRQSLSHAFSHIGVANILAVAVLPELIRSAIWISSELHEPRNLMVKLVHRFVAALSLAGELHRVLITAKEFYDGTVLYDHQVKKITLGGKSLEAHPREGKLDTQPAPSAEVKIGALLAGVNVRKMRFHPQRWAKVYDHWMGGLQDWCISRQLWWGHRIPVWYDRLAWSAFPKMIQVVTLTGKELTGTNARELRQSAWRLAKESGFLRQKFKNADTGWDIYVNRKSLEHGFANQGLVNILLVPGLPALLNSAALYASGPHVPPIPQVRLVHKFVAALELAGVLYRVKFTVKELPDGKKLYDHQAVTVQKNETDGNSPGTRLREEKLVTRPASASQIKVACLFEDVNTNEQFTRCQFESPGPGWSQDPDVLDTWFSSWLWPFATMGWTGDKSQDSQNPTLQAFYPTTDLVTGPDIIFFWVARMIMAGYEFIREMPFQNVYFTGIIRDKQGRKMSKSLGNSPDPLDLIGRYGADALRFGTMRSAPLGQDILFDEQNVELGRNFCNKLWNACRFRQMQGGEVQGEINPQLLTSDDKWILLRLDQTIREIDAAFAEYKFSDATATLYRFFWSEYCDWYVEATKTVLAQNVESLNCENDKSAGDSTMQQVNDLTAQKANALAVIDFVLSHTLRLFHPFLPFITEELWHGMGYADDLPENQGGQTIMTAAWPKPLDENFKAHYGLSDADDKFVSARNELISQGRNLRRISNVPAGKKISYVLKPANDLPAHDGEVIKRLLNAEAVELDSAWQPPQGTPFVHTELGELHLPLAGLVDFAAERARLDKELEKVRAEIVKVQGKLANPNFVQKVPSHILKEHQQRLADWQTKEKQLLDSLKNLPA